jgi:hypothetical protein
MNGVTRTSMVVLNTPQHGGGAEYIDTDQPP